MVQKQKCVNADDSKLTMGRGSLFVNMAVCPQVFSGLQGRSSAGGHRGGHPDGEYWLVLLSKLNCLCTGKKWEMFSPEYQ